MKAHPQMYFQVVSARQHIYHKEQLADREASQKNTFADGKGDMVEMFCL